MITIITNIVSLIYLALISIIYYSKKKAKSEENRIYSIMLIASIIGNILDPLSGILYYNNYNVMSLSYLILTKMILLYYLIWDISFFSYIILITNSDNSTKFKKILKIITSVLIVIVLFSPLKIVSNNNTISPVGLPVNLLAILTFILFIITIIFLIKNYKVVVNGTEYAISIELISEQEAKAAQAAPKAAPAAAPAAAAGEGEKINAPMPGNILAVNVKEGDVVKKGQVLMILEAMKMENEIMAGTDGTVTSVCVAKGATVETGTVLCTIK